MTNTASTASLATSRSPCCTAKKKSSFVCRMAAAIARVGPTFSGPGCMALRHAWTCYGTVHLNRPRFLRRNLSICKPLALDIYIYIYIIYVCMYVCMYVCLYLYLYSSLYLCSFTMKAHPHKLQGQLPEHCSSPQLRSWVCRHARSAGGIASEAPHTHPRQYSQNLSEQKRKGLAIKDEPSKIGAGPSSPSAVSSGLCLCICWDGTFGRNSPKRNPYPSRLQSTPILSSGA